MVYNLEAYEQNRKKAQKLSSDAASHNFYKGESFPLNQMHELPTRKNLRKHARQSDLTHPNL